MVCSEVPCAEIVLPTLSLPGNKPPTLETPRLILRPHRLSDFDAYVAMWSDPDVVRFVGGTPHGREGSWARFLRHAGMWQLMGFGYFALQEKATGAFVGEAGFHEMRRAVDPPVEGTLEAGWALARAAQGRGLAREAMEAAVAWADAAFPGARMTAIIDPGNHPSLRIAAGLGFTPFARTTFHDAPVTLFERFAPGREG